MGRQVGLRVAGVAVLSLLGSACLASEDRAGEAKGTGGVTTNGTTSFVSADSVQGASYGGVAASGTGGSTALPPLSSDDGSEERSVERGDIFRVLGDGRILNLNSFRGLQVINVSDPSAPVVEGELAIGGSPVEMYVTGDRAVVLLNDYRGYYGGRDDVRVEQVEGGLIVLLDLSDPTQPVELDRELVRGNLQTSRLSTGSEGTALYVAAQLWGQWNADEQGGRGGSIQSLEPSTVVSSLSVGASSLSTVSTIDLGGYVNDIQATPDYMMVARSDYSRTEAQNNVALIDIRSPMGTMVMGQDVPTGGPVTNKFAMDITGSVMRVVSGQWWNGQGQNTNGLETFDISDIHDVKPLAQCTFGDGQSLFATLFMPDRAFFVTYLRQDPFHAFSIGADGACKEESEFIVSGWNDFFRAVEDNTRLVGVGRNDERGNLLAVSLYDVTDLKNPSPLLARTEVALDHAYSEAQWDDRAFTVLENATSVLASDGTEETGLVLLPYEGWDDVNRTSVGDVQVFTFSASTLTLRGSMAHGSSVRRAFLTAEATTANLSEDALSLYDIADPDAPEALGRVALAPNYSEVFVFDDYLVRVQAPFRNGYYYNHFGMSQPAVVEVLPATLDANSRDVLTSFEVPGDAFIKRVGDLLVSVHMVDRTDYNRLEPVQRFDTTVQAWDLSNPRQPRRTDSLRTDRLTPYASGYYGGWGPALDCWGCGYYGRYFAGYQDGIYPAGDALLFAQTSPQQKSLGTVEYCREYPTGSGIPCTDDENTDMPTCTGTHLGGGVTCVTPEGGETHCEGGYYRCDNSSGECEPIDESEVRTDRYCYSNEAFRYWNAYSFEVLDLSDPDALALAETLAFPKSDEGTSVLVEGSKAYFNFQRPLDVAGDARPFVQRYSQIIDLSEPSAPTVSAAVNIPGEVIGARGTTLFTRDTVWSDSVSETMVARLALQGDVATLQSQKTFTGRDVSKVALDGAGHVLVSHESRWGNVSEQQQPVHKLTILDQADLSTLGEAEVDSWANLEVAKAGRAIYSVSGGMLVLNLEDPQAPFAQSYYPTVTGGELVLHGDALLFAAGSYGIYRFDLDSSNLTDR